MLIEAFDIVERVRAPSPETVRDLALAYIAAVQAIDLYRPCAEGEACGSASCERFREVLRLAGIIPPPPPTVTFPAKE